MTPPPQRSKCIHKNVCFCHNGEGACKEWGTDAGCIQDCNQYITIASQQSDQNKFPPSGDLLLIAHDEWKRRQERKGFDDEIPWVSGWISGYLTSKKFVDDRLIILHTHKGDGPP